MPDGDMQDVIQYIDHSEPAAVRDPEMLAEQARHDHADMVAQILHGHSSTEGSDPMEAEEVMETVSLLAYNRYPESFRLALTSGAALNPCRSALEEAGFNWEHTSGAKLFVHPWQFEECMTAVSENNIELRPYHVIVSSSLEYNVEACLADVPCRQGARVKRRRVLGQASRSSFEHGTDDLGRDVQMPPGEAITDEVANETEQAYEVRRTFLCRARKLRQANSVNQSTTEIHGGGLNPRRATGGYI
jgi:hypothetical protein